MNKTLRQHLQQTSSPDFQGCSALEQEAQDKIDRIRAKCAQVMGALSDREKALVALALNQLETL